MDELTLTVVSATILTEGVKFLYGQAGEALKRWRERRPAADSEQRAIAVPHEASSILEGELGPLTIDFDSIERVAPVLQELRQEVQDYAAGVKPIDVADERLLKTIDGLRLLMEAVYQQRITFKGEPRSESGPVVNGRIEADTVAGYVAAVRIDWMDAGRVTGEANVRRVLQGGEAIGVDIRKVGGQR